MPDEAYRDALRAAHERLAQLGGDPPANARRRPWLRAAVALGALGVAGAVAHAVSWARAERSASISGVAASNGWIVQFHVPPRATELAYKLPDDASFEPLGTVSWMRDPETNEPSPQTWTTIPFDRVRGPTPIAVRWVDALGMGRGPVTVTFDPVEEGVASVRSILAMTGAWIAFGDAPGGGQYVYFAPLLAYKHALREIRYSVDSDALDRRVRFAPSDRPGVAPSDELFVQLREPSRYVTVEVVFADGTTSGARALTAPSTGVGATALPTRPSAAQSPQPIARPDDPEY